VTPAPAPLPEPSALFAALPDPCLLLTADFRIAAANDAYVAAAGKGRPQLVGRSLLDVAGEIHGGAAEEGVSSLRLSLERVLHRTAADATTLLTVRRTSPEDGGASEERVWRLTNSPVFDGDRVSHILHRVEDVTDQRRTEDARAAVRQERDRLLRQLQTHVERLPLAYLVSGPDFRYTRWNPAAERLFGFREADVLGRHPFDVIVPPASRPLVADGFARLRGGDMDAHGVCANRTRDGREIVCEWHNTPLFDDGGFAGILSMAQDVTERVRLNAELEDRVRARTAELEDANKELEAFSYSVSHDLRAPLRAIDGFSTILMREHRERLPGAARECLELIHSNTRRMGCLIDDLLAFSRLARQPVQRDVIDTGRLVRQCLDELAGEIGGRAVEVIVGDLPPCRGDRALLKQVWTNLLSNALKYTRRRQPSEPAAPAAAGSLAAARVEVGCRRNESGGEDVYFVRDNGVGFDMRSARKLFGVFQRLHRAEDYEGTGVGLAIVQRVVHRHGGRVWAEAEPDKGAAFFFTLGGAGPR
jgi:PAS domain S-box-containing protein